MPGLFHDLISRHEFLKVIGASAAGGWLHLATGKAIGDEETPKKWHVALLSDTHLPGNEPDGYRGFKPADNLRKVVPQVVASRPEAVTLSGDAARRKGLREDYQALKKILAPVAKNAPILIGLGNHDDRRNFFAEFPAKEQAGSQELAGKHVAILEHPLLRIVMLDSLFHVNRVAGLMGKAQREWLRRTLPKTTDRPMVLFVHHTLGDGDGDLLDSDRLFQLLKPHSHVKAIFYGHSHQYNVTEREGVKCINLPATGYNFSDREPVGWVDAHFEAGGVKLLLHAIAGNQKGNGKTTEVAWAR